MPVTDLPELIAIRNTRPGPTVFTDRSMDLVVEWQGSGDPSGGDVQQVPSTLLRHPEFSRSLRLGVFEAVGDEALDEAIVRQDARHQDRQDEEAVVASTLVQPANSNDLLGLTCVGPGPRAGALCNAQVIVAERDSKTNPPLCSRHVAHAAEYRLSGDTWTRS